MRPKALLLIVGGAIPVGVLEALHFSWAPAVAYGGGVVVGRLIDRALGDKP